MFDLFGHTAAKATLTNASIIDESIFDSLITHLVYAMVTNAHDKFPVSKVTSSNFL